MADLELSAASHETRSMLPVPDSVRARGAALNRALAALVRRGFAAETIVNATDAVWRTDPDGQRIGLMITAEGLAAIGVEPGDVPEFGGGDVRPKRVRPSGKLGAILATVEKPDGASLVELADATGWLTSVPPRSSSSSWRPMIPNRHTMPPRST